MGVIDERGHAGGGGGGGAWCALCRAEYVAGVFECVDCVVPLADAPPLRPEEIGDVDGDQTAYELADVDAAERFAIDRKLAERGVVHAWDGTTLVVAPWDEADADAVIDPEERIDDALLDEDAEQVLYELDDWDEAQRGELAARLVQADLPHLFDEDGNLVVLAADEEQVDALVDDIDFPDQLDASPDHPGALDAAEVVGALFVAADRLSHDPDDNRAVIDAADAAEAMQQLPTPYGYSPAAWEDLVDRARELRELLASEDMIEDQEVIEVATRVRAALRRYV